MGKKTVIQLVFAMLTVFNVAGPLILDMQTVAPAWPWQAHALIGFMAFAGVMVWMIVDRQRKINEFEDSYAYALSFDGLNITPVGEMIDLGLNLSNTLEKPIEYIVENIYLEIGESRLPNFQYKNRGQVISGRKSGLFQFPAFKTPNSIPCKGLLRYELVYGRPGKPMFRQIRELELTLRTVDQVKALVWQFTQQEDIPIKK